MDQQYLEREKELFKLNAKLNAKTKKFIGNNKCVQLKTVQITTSNSNFNFYQHEEKNVSSSTATSEEINSLEISCKKITIANPPIKKQNDINYPLYRNTTATSKPKKSNIDIRIPHTEYKDQNMNESSQKFSNSQDNLSDIRTDKTEKSFNEESLLVRFASESSITAPQHAINHANVIPKILDKPNVSSEGLIK